MQWLSADGTQLLTLTDRAAGYRLQSEATAGLAAPPYRFTTDQYAGVDGVTVTAVTADARELVLGLLIEAPDEDTLDARYAAVARAMRPKAGPGTLIATAGTGRRRTMACYYTGGLEGVEARGSKLPGRWCRAAVHLMAEDPWWYGDEQSVSFSLGAPVVFFTPTAGFPLTLSSSSVQGAFAIDLSDSDAPAYPLWTITGPGTSLTLTNLTTGQVITVNATLTSGQTMSIDTRPGFQSVRRGDGTNLMGSVTSDPALWALVEDVNQVTASLSGATSASRIAATFQPRYAGT